MSGLPRRGSVRRMLLYLTTVLVIPAIAAGTTEIAAETRSPVSQRLRHQTFTYKTVDFLEIQAEVSRIDDEELRPVLVWIHGGALMKGDRFDQWDRPFTRLMLEAGYVIVSIDYRLAPETRLPAIVEDVADACAWVRADGPRLFKARVDRLAVAGGSAGGYLTLAAGRHAQTPPTVLASFSGYCDLVGTWATGPSVDPEHSERTLGAEEMTAFEAGPPVSNKYERTYDITPYYNTWRLQGIWPLALTGWDPASEREYYLPYLNDRDLPADYPPTILVHGTADLDVDYRQAVQMAEALEAARIQHQLILLEGGDHNLGGIEPGRTEDALRKAMAFVRYHMEE